jgi:hypothetical protein
MWSESHVVVERSVNVRSSGIVVRTTAILMTVSFVSTDMESMTEEQSPALGFSRLFERACMGGSDSLQSWQINATGDRSCSFSSVRYIGSHYYLSRNWMINLTIVLVVLL